MSGIVEDLRLSLVELLIVHLKEMMYVLLVQLTGFYCLGSPLSSSMLILSPRSMPVSQDHNYSSPLLQCFFGKILYLHRFKHEINVTAYTHTCLFLIEILDKEQVLQFNITFFVTTGTIRVQGSKYMTFVHSHFPVLIQILAKLIDNATHATVEEQFGLDQTLKDVYDNTVSFI